MFSNMISSVFVLAVLPLSLVVSEPPEIPEAVERTSNGSFVCPSDSGVYRNEMNPCSPMYWNCIAGEALRFECDPGFIVEIDRSSSGYGMCRLAEPETDCNPASTSDKSRLSRAELAESIDDNIPIGLSALPIDLFELIDVQLPTNSTSDPGEMMLPNVCEQLDDGNHVLHECNRDFVICKDGLVKRKFWCDIGFVMNITSRSCVEASDECMVMSGIATDGSMKMMDSRCVGMTDGLYSSGGPCTPSYYICESGMLFYQAACEEGKTKDLSTSECVQMPDLCRMNVDKSNDGNVVSSPSSSIDDLGSEIAASDDDEVETDGLDCGSLTDGAYTDGDCSRLVQLCVNGSMVFSMKCAPGHTLINRECKLMPEKCSLMKMMLDDEVDMEEESGGQKHQNFDDSILVKIKLVNGRSFEVQVLPSLLVQNLKQSIRQMVDFPLDQQRLIFNGKELANDQTVSHYGIKDGSRLHLILRLQGR